MLANAAPRFGEEEEKERRRRMLFSSAAEKTTTSKTEETTQTSNSKGWQVKAGESPVLIRIETNAGHGAGTPVAKTIEQYADIFGFTLFNMGFKELPNPPKPNIKS